MSIIAIPPKASLHLSQMASCNKRTRLQTPKPHFSFSPSFTAIFFFFLPLAIADPLVFNFTWFGPNTMGLQYAGNATTVSSGEIQLTTNRIDASLQQSVGRAIYDQQLHLWDRKTGKLADFTTHFSFIIDSRNRELFGDGLAFFLAPNGSDIPPDSAGGALGLFNFATANDSSVNKMVAVEFDSFMNDWDPSNDHVGINVNSIISVANVSWKSSIKNGSQANAWVSYNATTHNLSVFLTYAKNPVFGGNSSLYHIVDLRSILPEWVDVGFSAATGSWVELHQILSWDFSSSDISERGGNKRKKIGIAVGASTGVGVLVICGLGFAWIDRWMRRRRRRKEDDKDLELDVCMDDEFEKGTGPKRFSRLELAQATNNFAEDGKLGEGGFGGVYKGFLKESNTTIAVKRVSQGSKQGRKEYMSEVKIISQLRHRNLVQLIGWCHERGEFLLVYEFMPNGSLDSHLFRGKSLLTWGARFKIAQGLANALLYLHEEWEQCVVHRDVKASNVMLDSGLNAKLGDFGLARLVEHGLGSQTTVLAGTMGYLAPECVTTGKASKESDVYSFGIVALEIACGRRPVEPKAEAKKVRLVEWVWDLYGRGSFLDAADSRLNREFDEKEMERLMVVGLWCAHPDFNLRPSIRQVINLLDSQAPLPNLPPQMPVPMYFAPPMDLCKFSHTSSNLGTDSTAAYSSKSNLSSSSSASSATVLLKKNNLPPPDGL
ncbi:hypothetical protein ACLOJK_003178 [Asimina triloba]